MPLSENWRDQYERMLRSRARLTEAAGPSSVSSDEARDRLYHFFQDAFHLRDWLRYSDDQSIATRAQALWGSNNHIKATPALALCHDLCIGMKHFTVERPATGDKTTTVDRQDVSIGLPAFETISEFPGPVQRAKDQREAGKPGVTSRHSWRVVSAGQTCDAIDLADQVIVAWDSWLKANGLL